VTNSRLSLMSLRSDLLSDWPRFQRSFPWRDTRNPYALLLAEVLLHRTRANQVVDIYRRLLSTYPDIGSLADADLADLTGLLRSAGLRWRVVLLLRAAEVIREKYNGAVPLERAELESIPGIGHYIASAIRCFAFQEPDAIIDTNTVRVLARVFGLPISDSLRRNREFHGLAEKVLDPEHPREYNFALLDLAASICLPRNPLCSECPIQPYCSYGGGRPPII
jgi:A/G-specific adenine glycosylase